MATAVTSSALPRSSKPGASPPPLGASPHVPADPGWRPVHSALPTDPASLPVHSPEEPALVEQQPHATPDLLEAEADAIADVAPSPAPAEGSAPHHRRSEDDNANPASAPRAARAPPTAPDAFLA